MSLHPRPTVLTLVATAAAVLLAAHRGGAQELSVDFEALVTADDPEGVYVEPQIAVDPADPSRMVVAAIHLREPASDAWQDRQTVAVFASRDGGRSWARRALEKLPDTWVAGDPWLAWGPGSRVYLSAVVAESLTRRGALQFTGVFHSLDGGWTWGDGPERPFPDSARQDHPWIGVVDSTIAVAGSIADRTGEGLHLATGRATDPPLFWSTGRLEPGWPQVNLGGGALMPDGALVMSYYTMVPPRRYAVRRLEPGGARGPEAVLAEDFPPLGFPPLARQRGTNRVFAAWAEGPEPSITLRVAVSPDGGRSWAPGGAIAPDTGFSLRTLPALAVARDGTVALVWQALDERGACTRLEGAVSVDGGRTFLPPARVSAAASCFGTAANGAAASRFRLGGGDYQGLAPAGSGPTFQAVWADSRSGTFQIRTARVRVVGDP
jgi:hypothetical protein